MALVTDRIFTAGQIRNAEWGLINNDIVSNEQLIETAAGAVVRTVVSIGEKLKVAALVGPGNNGADALAASRMLAAQGYTVDVWEKPSLVNASSPQRVKLIESGLPVSIGSMYETIEWASYDVVMDGLFGIGINRKISEEDSKVIDSLNFAHRDSDQLKVIAIDIPSGVNADNGLLFGNAVQADMTVTFSAIKPGLILYPGRAYAGKVMIADAGVFAEALPDSEFTRLTCVPELPERDPAGHKGTFGRILIVAGSDTGPGAALLTTKACYRSGAGLCKLVTPEAILPEVLHTVPEAVFCGRERFLENPAAEMKGCSVILIGPGLGTDEEAERLLDSVLAVADEWNNPESLKHVIVLDADALNILSKRLTGATPQERMRELRRLLPKNCIFTPHLAELGRLFGVSVADIPGSRLDIARMWNYETDHVFIMKDACTLVVGEGTVRFNETGNDGMGTAGSGDVLAGITAALAMEFLHGTMSLTDCAAAAVAVHGTAGDLAAADIGRRSLMAGDLVRYLPKAYGAPCAAEEE